MVFFIDILLHVSARITPAVPMQIPLTLLIRLRCLLKFSPNQHRKKQVPIRVNYVLSNYKIQLKVTQLCQICARKVSAKKRCIVSAKAFFFLM